MSPLLGPERGPHDFNCARVHRGQYTVGGDIRPWAVRHDFRILHGEATIKPGKSIVVSNDDGSDSTSILETFYIFPQSPYVRLDLEQTRGRTTMNLWREEDRRKSRIYKQRLATRSLGFAREARSQRPPTIALEGRSDSADTSHTWRDEPRSLQANDTPRRMLETPPRSAPSHANSYKDQIYIPPVSKNIDNRSKSSKPVRKEWIWLGPVLAIVGVILLFFFSANFLEKLFSGSVFFYGLVMTDRSRRKR